MIDDTIGNAKTMQPNEGGKLGRIDQYELVRELGGGGFGTVFLAKDTVAGIEVAVKGLPPFVKNSREELETIRDNFALVSRLTHTNIAKALVLHPSKDVFYSSEDVRQKLRVLSGDTLMVMEYAPGVTLSKWRKQFPHGKVPFDKALSIVRQIASALDYAHGQKILHRDIKPANIMVETRDGERVVVRVLDFGLAAEIRSSMGRVSREIHDTSGTRPYMAPEQWEGARQGPATDQYSLAVLFHELVTGVVPFASIFDTGDPVVMMNVVGNKPFKASNEFPKSVRRALEKALSKKPAERFANCCEFVEALEVERPANFLKLVLVAALFAALCGVGVLWLDRHNESKPSTNETQGSSSKVDESIPADTKVTPIEPITANPASGNEGGASTTDVSGISILVTNSPLETVKGDPRTGGDSGGHSVPQPKPGKGGQDSTQPSYLPVAVTNSRMRLTTNVTMNMIYVGANPTKGIMDGFWLGETEVTQKQWLSVMPNNPSWFKGDLNRPVESVSLAACQEFLEKIQATVANEFPGFKASLPTTNQWKHACRAGNDCPYGIDHFSNDNDKNYITLKNVAWFKDNSEEKTQFVRSRDKQPNKFGFYDMLGNVSEWCVDNEGASSYFYCGESYLSSLDYFENEDFKLGTSSDFVSKEIGFRVALIPIDEANGK